MVFVRDNGAEINAPDAYNGSVTSLVLAIAAGEMRDVREIATAMATMISFPTDPAQENPE